MALERMKLLSIIGQLEDLDRVSRLVVMNGSIHMLNAISELKNNSLNLPASKQYMQTLQELTRVKPYEARRDFTGDESLIGSFQELFNLKPEIDRLRLDKGYDDYESALEELRKVHDTVKDISAGIRKKSENIERLQNYLNNVGYIRNTDLEIQQLINMNFIKFRLLMLSNENFKRLELNMENIPSVVLQAAAVEGSVVIATFTPKGLLEEADRIFASLNCRELELPQEYPGAAEEVINRLNEKAADEKREIEELKKSVRELSEKYTSLVERAYVLLQLEKKAEKVREDTALGHRMFFMLGFVPESEVERVRKDFQQRFNNSVVLMFDDAEKSRPGSVPTRMKNNLLFRPFETLVNMYGTPSYGEKDPTPFFAISYMLLFGAMFGDLGQGLIILLAGIFASYKRGNKSFGGILTRLGASSMIFGTLYGSIFGSEEIIEPLLIRPMANINTMLVSAIALGIILITISYIYSLVNLYGRRDVEEGLFGREGLAGFLFFLTLVLGALGMVTGKLAGIGLPLGTAVVLLLLMVFKQPLAGLVTNNRHHEESAADYYIEAGFGVIETVLSSASNIISFIRVGAFALNHVGLYIAFATMAEMLKSKTGGIAILVMGNIFIIGLEGLVVFIQSLRLEYYELFSKYYSGYGIEYKPISLYSENDEE